MAIENAILAQSFNSPDEMFEWVFSLVGSEVEYEDAPSTVIVNVESLSFNFYPMGYEAPAGALLCVVVVSVKEKDD